jgi:hypothetical protein
MATDESEDRGRLFICRWVARDRNLIDAHELARLPAVLRLVRHRTQDSLQVRAVHTAPRAPNAPDGPRAPSLRDPV